MPSHLEAAAVASWRHQYQEVLRPVNTTRARNAELVVANPLALVLTVMVVGELCTQRATGCAPCTKLDQMGRSKPSTAVCGHWRCELSTIAAVSGRGPVSRGLTAFFVVVRCHLEPAVSAQLRSSAIMYKRQSRNGARCHFHCCPCQLPEVFTAAVARSTRYWTGPG